jgi:uncharacterized membrane protein
MSFSTIKAKASQRIEFLDWMRGCAAVIMLQGHTFDAFANAQTRNSSAFTLSQFVGGEAAAIFLFLTGATYGMGMNRREHLIPGGRVIAALKRARYLFLLGILFRLQGWIFAWGRSPISDLFRVDILNVMGATAGLVALLAFWNGMDRVRGGVLVGALIAFISPVMSVLPLGSLPAPLRAYLIPSADGFPIFPWGAYLVFGVALGSMIPLVKKDAWNRIMQWSALVGFGLLMGGRYFADLPYSVYEHSEFWLNSPALVACKLGIAMLLGSAAYIWMEYLNTGWSFVRQLGTTSLIVYWLHVDLEYGPWLSAYRQKLGVAGCVTAALVMIVAMVSVSVAFTRIRAHYKRGPVPVSRTQQDPAEVELTRMRA